MQNIPVVRWQVLLMASGVPALVAIVRSSTVLSQSVMLDRV